MCGIVGYLGNKEAYPIIVKGLKRLEYRGYDSAGVAVSRSMTSDGAGEISLLGLVSTSYVNITASLNGCTSNAENEVLSDPGIPVITSTKTDPTTCNGDEGIFTITGLLASTKYLISYDSLGTLVSDSLTSDGSGDITITGLSSGAYTTITASAAGCTSNAESEVLSDPGTPTITTVKTDPIS